MWSGAVSSAGVFLSVGIELFEAVRKESSGESPRDSVLAELPFLLARSLDAAAGRSELDEFDSGSE